MALVVVPSKWGMLVVHGLPTSAVPVAVNVTVGRLGLLAVSVLVPGSGPSIHAPIAAIPEASVRTDEPETVPPPLPMVNDTGTPPTGLLLASVTNTAGGMLTGALAVALWPSPADATIEVGVTVGGA
jgi:hypothetical protein